LLCFYVKFASKFEELTSKFNKFASKFE